MTQLLRTGKYDICLNLEHAAIDGMLAMLDAALDGEIVPFQIEMSGRVFGRRWAQEFKPVQFRVVASEADRLTWDAGELALCLAIEADVIQMTLVRLTEAKTTRCFWPAEWCEVHTGSRPQRDSMAVVIS